jgi:chemotaxis response regulator CheB
MALSEDTLLRSGHCYLGTNGRAISFEQRSGHPVLHLPESEDLGGLVEGHHLDGILAAASETWGERLTIAFFSGAEIGNLDGIRAVRAKGGRVVVADPQLAVVADTLELLVDGELADKVAAPTDIIAYLI